MCNQGKISVEPNLYITNMKSMSNLCTRNDGMEMTREMKRDMNRDRKGNEKGNKGNEKGHKGI